VLANLRYLTALPPFGKLIHLWIFSCLASSPICLCTYWLYYLPHVLNPQRKQQAKLRMVETARLRAQKEATTAQTSPNRVPTKSVSAWRVLKASCLTPHHTKPMTSMPRIRNFFLRDIASSRPWPRPLSSSKLSTPPTTLPTASQECSKILQGLVRCNRFSAFRDGSGRGCHDDEDSEEEGVLFIALWAHDRVWRMLWHVDGSLGERR